MHFYSQELNCSVSPHNSYSEHQYQFADTILFTGRKRLPQSPDLLVCRLFLQDDSEKPILEPPLLQTRCRHYRWQHSAQYVKKQETHWGWIHLKSFPWWNISNLLIVEAARVVPTRLSKFVYKVQSGDYYRGFIINRPPTSSYWPQWWGSN